MINLKLSAIFSNGRKRISFKGQCSGNDTTKSVQFEESGADQVKVRHLYQEKDFAQLDINVKPQRNQYKWDTQTLQWERVFS